MEQYDCLIAGGIVVRHDGCARADVAILDGKVAEIGLVDPAAARQVIDAGDRMVLPGVIDPHVHMSILPTAGDDRQQIDLIKRDILTESRAAAFGGVTTFLPMINLEGSYLPYLDDLRHEIESSSHVDAGMTVVVSSADHVAEIPEVAAFGISGFKHFLNAYRRDKAVGALLPIDERSFFESLVAIRALGPPALAMVHAEDADLIEAFESRLRATEPEATDLRALSRARPPACETIRMHFAASAADAIGTPVYFCHCSCFEGVRVLEPFVHNGGRVAVEAVTHCLTSNHDEAWARVGVWGKFSPPIRSESDRRALWAAARQGTIRHFASDHCTWTREEKENGGDQFGSIWSAMPGISNGMEHLLPALITYGVATGEVSWEGLVAATSFNTAKRFGYLPQKGDLSVGADADLVILDPRAHETVGPGFYHGRGADWSLYWGQRLFGRPELTMVRGRTVQARGELLARPGDGAFVRPLFLRNPAVPVS